MRFLSFTLYDERNSRKTHLNQTLLSSILAGMMLVLTFYHLMFFIVIRNKEYLYYVLYLIGSSLIILQMSGVLANAIGFYYNAVNNYWLLALSTTPLFLSLFIKVIFDTKNTAQYKYENGLLNFMVVVFIIMFVIGLFDMTTAINIMPYPYIFFFISIILISISMIVKKDSLAHYFLFGTIVFMICSIINDLYVMSILPYSLFVINAPGIGITVESIALAFMLSHKLKMLQKESILAQVNVKEQKRILQQNVILQEKIASAVEKTRKKDKLLFQQNKLASMGQMLENIAHQWRQPLSQINSSILLIDNYLGEKDKPDAVISSYLDQIETQTSHMSETIDNFRRFHRPNSHSVNSTLKEVIENSLSILHATLLSKRITIQTTIESGTLYKGNSEKIQQVFIAILTNAIDALTKSKTTSPRITIIIKELDTEFIIDVCDTAGGISEQEINQVFDKYYSSKDETEYGGLGLYIAKEILEKNQLGHLSVSNDQAGACFKITLYKRAQP
jgi:signal transduction histidine kinase